MPTTMNRLVAVAPLLLLLTTTTSCLAWSPPSSQQPAAATFRTAKAAAPPPVAAALRASSDSSNEGSGDCDDSIGAILQRRVKSASTAAAAAALAAALWTGAGGGAAVLDNGNFAFQHPPAAAAKEMASGSGSRVNKDPESLLRFGLPIKNDKEVRKLQVALEAIKQDVGSKRKAAALDGVKKSKGILSSSSSKLTANCRDAKVCTDIIGKMGNDLDPLANALKDSMDTMNGSEQERDALDKAYAAQKVLTDELTDLEEQMVPANYYTPVPEDYSDLPQLRGRATVEMTLTKPDKTTYDVSGNTFKEAKLVMVVDGYAAPITAGNFVELVQKGFYTNMAIQRSDGFVVQTGDPDGDAVGYVAKGSKALGTGKNGERLIPLEIFIKGDAQPIYESTMEDEGRGGQATVLPFASYGAMGWAREEYDVNSGSSQFFWLLFDSDLTPAGKNVLDGRYPWYVLLRCIIPVECELWFGQYFVVLPLLHVSLRISVCSINENLA